MIKAGIFGATGYTGVELAKILTRHPNVDIQFATSQSFAGQQLSDIYPTAPAIELIKSEAAPIAKVDVVFLCLPHAAAAETAVHCLKHNIRVIDLSADFRLKDAATYAQWYNQQHPAPELLETAVYGLTECARAALPSANLVATPGCYPTSILLPLMPLLHSRYTITPPIIADSKSGISGAGRTPKQNTHFVEAANNFSPYKIGRSHRHLPEIEQIMNRWRPNSPDLIFSPHLLPVPRGILSTLYITLDAPPNEAEVREIYGRYYTAEPFITILPHGQHATLAHVVHTNKCVIGITIANHSLIITSAIDNLQKGAAGQAVQNMNVMFGCDEITGLAH